MNNYKIKVNNEAESKEAQELFFELGFEWKYRNIGKNYYKDNSVGFLYADNGCITTGEKITGENCFENHTESHKELTLPELRDMVVLKRNDINDATHACESKHNRRGYLSSNGIEYIWFYGQNEWFKAKISFTKHGLKPIEKKMKEYLDSKRNYEFVLSTEKEEGFIEIPVGAEQATLCGTFIAFWKDGAAFFVGVDADWDTEYELDCSKYLSVTKDSGAKIIWQRATHPEELPFIDDEPKSINDQYAEIEQVRQQSINETLAERQSSYGCYEDVAHVTQEILKALRSSGGYDRMPAPHKESMHMIASKMARLVCGDHNHKDSWHDIGGYAKLIENLID